MSQPLSVVYAQQSILEQFNEFEKERRHPQLAIYKNKNWEQLFIYSYDRASIIETIYQLFVKASYYALSFLGKVEFKPDEISQRQKAIENAIAQKCLDFSRQTKESSIASLNERETQLQTSETRLLTVVKTLIQQEEELKSKIKQCESSFESLQQKYDEKKKSIEAALKLSTEIKELEERLARYTGDIHNAGLRRGALSQELQNLETRKTALLDDIRTLSPQTKISLEKQIQNLQQQMQDLKHRLKVDLLGRVLHHMAEATSRISSEYRRRIFPLGETYDAIRNLLGYAVPKALDDEIRK